MRRLVGPHRPGLVSWTRDESIAEKESVRPLRSVPGIKSRIAFCVDDAPPVLDAFWLATRLALDEIVSCGLFYLRISGETPPPWAGILAGRLSMSPAGVRAFCGPWDGTIEPPPAGPFPGFALRLEPTPAPELEAERVRRILSAAPAAFIEAGWGRVPEFLVYGDPQAIRALPPGLVDVAVIPGERFIRGDEALAPLVAMHVQDPVETAPVWAGLPVMMGPRLFWRSGWLEDSRTRNR